MAIWPFSYLKALNILSNLAFAAGTTSIKERNKTRKALK
jgi:hypothetical protein